jgi:hypothetical protein
LKIQSFPSNLGRFQLPYVQIAFLSLFSSWDPPRHVGSRGGVRQIPWALFTFPYSLFLCSSINSVISLDLSVCSLIRSVQPCHSIPMVKFSFYLLYFSNPKFCLTPFCDFSLFLDSLILCTYYFPDFL